MDHCTAANLPPPSRMPPGANKQPVIHRMIITHFVSANDDTSSPFYPRIPTATKGELITNRAGLRAFCFG